MSAATGARVRPGKPMPSANAPRMKLSKPEHDDVSATQIVSAGIDWRICALLADGKAFCVRIARPFAYDTARTLVVGSLLCAACNLRNASGSDRNRNRLVIIKIERSLLKGLGTADPDDS